MLTMIRPRNSCPAPKVPKNPRREYSTSSPSRRNPRIVALLNGGRSTLDALSLAAAREQLLAVIGGGIMERHRSVGHAGHELHHRLRMMVLQIMAGMADGP